MSTTHPLHAVGPEAVAATIAERRTTAVAVWDVLVRAMADPVLVAEVDAAGRAFVQALVDGGALLVAGNGGSAADASHIATELTGKCIHDRPPLPAINLSESLSSLTAVGNDYGFEQVFARGVAAHGRAGDVFLGMTTSGTSANVLLALRQARERGMVTIAMTGAKGEGLRGAADHVLVVPSDETPRIQELHMLWAHTWCEAVDVLCQ